MAELEKETFEALSPDTQDRIMQLCEKAGMPYPWLQALHMILKDIDNPNMEAIIEVRGSDNVPILQGVRGDIDKVL